MQQSNLQRFSFSELLINHLQSYINDTHENNSGCYAEAGDSRITGQPLFPPIKNKPGDWVADQSIQLGLFFYLCIVEVIEKSPPQIPCSFR